MQTYININDDLDIDDDFDIEYNMKLNKLKGLKVAKEELRSIGLMVSRLND